MEHIIALDLKVARRKAGLTQQDLAHLLEISAHRAAVLERADAFRYRPRELCTLSVIYDQPIEGLLGPWWPGVHQRLSQQLTSLPAPPATWINTYNRQHTIDGLAARLDANLGPHGSG